jgi:uncharacterized protein
MFMLEATGAHAAVAHALCIGLVAGRVSHACGAGRHPENFRFRVLGMALTFAALVGAAAGLILLPVWRALA